MNKWIEKYNNGEISKNELEAIRRYMNGEIPSMSTFIDEVSMTIGYGRLDNIGEFEYSIIPEFRKEINLFGGALTWKDYFLYHKNKEREKKLNRILQ